MFLRLLKKIAVEFKRAKIPYMVIGGQAILLYGEPRLTKDIDITLGISPEELARLQPSVMALGLKVLVENPRDFVEKAWVLPLLEEKSGIRVDLIFSFSVYERAALERAKAVNLGKTKVKFASLEDVIIHKVIAGRPRDLEDIKNLLLKNPHCDSDYVKNWLKEFDLSLGERFLEVFNAAVESIKT